METQTTETRQIPAPVVRIWARSWPCNGFPDAALQFTVDDHGDLVDYRFVTKNSDGDTVDLGPLGWNHDVDERAVIAIIDDVQAGDVATFQPGHLEV